jgi:hypothetical protein
VLQAGRGFAFNSERQGRGGEEGRRTWWNLMGVQSLLTAAAAAPSFAEELALGLG